MFFDRLLTACNMNGLTVSALLALLKMSTGSIKRWREGTEPNKATVDKIADKLGVTRAYLMEESDIPYPVIPPTAETVEGNVPDIQKVEAMGLYDQMTDEQRISWIAVAKEFVRNQSDS